MITIRLLKIITNILIISKNNLDRLGIRIGYWKIRHLLILIINSLTLNLKRQQLFHHYNSVLNRPILVFDVGCNIGLYTDIFLKLSKKVVAIDANKELLIQFENNFKELINEGKLVVIHSAITENIGKTTFYTMSSVNLSSTSEKWKDNVLPEMFNHVENINIEDVPSTTLDDLICQYGVPDYIKMDIEGGECSAIQGLNQSVGLISIEVTLPYLYKEILSIIDKLSQLNYYQFRILREGKFQFDKKIYNKTQLKEMIAKKKINGVFELYCFLNQSLHN